GSLQKGRKRSRRIKEKNAGDRDSDRRIPGGPARHGGKTCGKNRGVSGRNDGKGSGGIPVAASYRNIQGRIGGKAPRGDRKLQKQPESRRGSSGFHERSHREQEDAGQGETGERSGAGRGTSGSCGKSQNNDPDSQKRQRRSLSVPAAQDGRTAAGCLGTWKTGCALPHGLRKRQRFPNGSGDLCADILSGADPAGGQQAVPGNVRRPV